MAPAKPTTPSTVTYDDHEVITPDHRTLRQAMVPATGDEEDPVTRAEQALAQLSGELRQMDERRLRTPRRRPARDQGFRPHGEKPRYSASRRRRHQRQRADIRLPRGRAGCRQSVPAARTHAGYDAEFRSSSSTSMSTPFAPSCANMAARISPNMATVLGSRLRQVTEEFLLQENRHRPEYLQSIASPPLSSGDLL